MYIYELHLAVTDGRTILESSLNRLQSNQLQLWNDSQEDINNNI